MFSLVKHISLFSFLSQALFYTEMFRTCSPLLHGSYHAFFRQVRLDSLLIQGSAELYERCMNINGFRSTAD
ncbi:hypothetical protein GGR57DRAFT_68995 [Xylariaceae sp. FL1272]|nr:hypothetical protein GGR57DRAFT_68995 [Xylariaceae sp. FL1272]